MSKKINLLETGNMLLAAQKIVLCCHVSPDGDTLGSALGLARLLEQKGKEVTVFVDDDINKSLSFIPSVDKVQRPEAGVIVEADLFVVVDASSFDRVGICNEVVKAPALLNIDQVRLCAICLKLWVGNMMKLLLLIFTLQSPLTVVPSVIPTLLPKPCNVLPNCWIMA